MQLASGMLAGWLAAAAAVVIGGYALRRRYSRPKDREAARRRLIETQGRFIEGTVTDYRDGVVVYNWSWRGVEYEASQDVRGLGAPESIEQVVGPVTVRFLARDPSNSIVVSERWSGFRNATAGSPSKPSSSAGSTAE